MDSARVGYSWHGKRIGTGKPPRRQRCSFINNDLILSQENNAQVTEQFK